MDKPQISWLSDQHSQKQRLHLQHGPIDLLISADGEEEEKKLAYQQAIAAFENVLMTLVTEINLLRSPVHGDKPRPKGEIASNMWSVAFQYASKQFITPMIAVAGAVADYVLQAMQKGRLLKRASVNNGGDIAIYLMAGQTYNVGICNNPLFPEITASVCLSEELSVRGVATSGWRGRSFSFGIADSVTVLAGSAAHADAAATLIANAVDLPGSNQITRVAASQLAPDNDLGDRLVTTEVGRLASHDIKKALSNGKRVAQQMLNNGAIYAVFASLQSGTFSVGNMHVLNDSESGGLVCLK